MKNSYDIKDMPPRDFIRLVSLRITTIHTLRFGLLLSCGDSLAQASQLALHDDPHLLAQACTELVRLGYMRVCKHEGPDQTDRPVMVANNPTTYDPDQADVEVPGKENETKH